jgi:hypothetical protein
LENKATNSNFKTKKTKDLANKIREVKIHKPGMFAASFGSLLGMALLKP